MRECQEGRGERVTIEEIAAMIEQEREFHDSTAAV